MRSSSRFNPYTSFEKRWSPELLPYGFTMVPNLLLYSQAVLGISSVAMMLLLHLEKHRFDERLVYPTRDNIAAYMGIRIETVSAAAAQLEKAGLIIITKRGRSYEYDLLPTIKKLRDIAHKNESKTK